LNSTDCPGLKTVAHTEEKQKKAHCFCMSALALAPRIIAPLRSTIALGIVGAGGIGQDIKNAINLLNFPHLGVLILIVVVMVTIVDQLSNRLRQSLCQRA